MSRDREGLAAAALCAGVAAFVPAVAKLTASAGSALLVSLLTSTLAGGVALAVLLARGEWRLLWNRAQLPVFAGVAVFGTAVPFFLLFEGARRTSALETVLCLQTEPLFALLGARIVLGHGITRRRLAAVTCLMLGIGLAVEARAAGEALGFALLLAAPLCWQASHLLVLRGLGEVRPAVLTSARYLFGAVLLAVGWLVVEGRAGFDRQAVLEVAPALAVQGVVLAYGGTWLWFEAMRRLDLTRATALVVPSIPIMSLGASFWLLGELPSARQLAGLALAVGGLVVFVRSPGP